MQWLPVRLRTSLTARRYRFGDIFEGVDMATITGADFLSDSLAGMQQLQALQSAAPQYFKGTDGKMHSAGSFKGFDGKYHAKGSFYGRDGNYHPAESFLGTDRKYHLKGSFLGKDNAWHIQGSKLGRDGNYHGPNAKQKSDGTYVEDKTDAMLQLLESSGAIA